MNATDDPRDDMRIEEGMWQRPTATPRDAARPVGLPPARPIQTNAPTQPTAAITKEGET